MLEDAGYRRWEIGKLSRRYIRQVLSHARKKDGSLQVGKEEDSQAPADRWAELRHVLTLRGYQIHQIAARLRTMKEQMETAEKETADRNRR